LNSYLKSIKLYRNENTLIERALNNNRKAQNVLFERYAPKMLSVCRYYIRDLHYAEEVMLKGFFKVFTKLNQYKKEGNFEGWIRRIMVREALSFLRQKKQIEFTNDQIEFHNTNVSTASTHIELDEIQQLIDALPDGYRIVFNMYVLEGYKHNEIAEILSITEGTSKSQLFKARKILQQRIAELKRTHYGIR
jgi:RNA polymerase sigma factor (sigma-70 family)